MKRQCTSISTQSPLRASLEERERQYLHPRAQLSCTTAGRLTPEPECPLRTAYQRDRDRIVHCKAFRRLKHKTQVFLSPSGDHYRTRLTHTLEVSQIARTIGRALALNEDLIEAVALGHDLGHTPFGHIGERVLNDIVPGGFHHNEQSLRVVDHLENNGRGLNLTLEVRDGILKHSKGRSNPIQAESDHRSITLEGRVVRLADIVAYLNHDLDDSLRAEILKPEDLPTEVRRALGDTHGKRIHSLVQDIVSSSLETELDEICLSPDMLGTVEMLRSFLFERVYETPPLQEEMLKARKIIGDLYSTFLSDDQIFEREIGALHPDMPREHQVRDYIAGMTDRYALDLFERLFIPRPWMKL